MAPAEDLPDDQPAGRQDPTPTLPCDRSRSCKANAQSDLLINQVVTAADSHFRIRSARRGCTQSTWEVSLDDAQIATILSALSHKCSDCLLSRSPDRPGHLQGVPLRSNSAKHFWIEQTVAACFQWRCHVRSFHCAAKRRGDSHGQSRCRHVSPP